MDDNFQLLDILFLALVAGFLVLRLRSVLGKRTGYEQTPDELARRKPDAKKDNVVDLTAARNGTTTDSDQDISFEPVNAAPFDDTVAHGLADIQAADPDFDAQNFLGGSQKAFEMIVTAFAEGRLDDIRPFLSDDVYNNFSKAVQDLKTAGETVESQFIGMKSTRITEANLNGNKAIISVEFITEQVEVIRNTEGEVVDGDPNFIATLTDVWTFSRDVTSENVNWMLMVTRSVEA